MNTIAPARRLRRALGWLPALPLLLAAAAAIAPAGPAHGQPQPAAAPAPAETVKVRAVAQFSFDDTGLSAADRSALLAEVARIQNVSWQRITAVGHTDHVGDAAYNEALALRRARAVREHLVAQGIPPALIEIASRGEAQPVATNDSADGRARNRRTEVEFVGVRTR